MRLRLLVAVLLLATAGCEVPVATALDEADANRIVIALDHAEIAAGKEIDPSSEGKFRVLVARDEVSRALTAMRDEELPRPRPKGVLDAIDKSALVPSAQAEHAQMVAGLAGDLERTLVGIDGVLSARVHLNVPANQPFRDGPPSKSSASVLLEYRGSTPPVAPEAVQRLVAGGVSGLVPTEVSVVTISRAAPAANHEKQLARVGPIAVARASSRTLQLALGGLLALVGVLALTVLALFARLARLRSEPLEKS